MNFFLKKILLFNCCFYCIYTTKVFKACGFRERIRIKLHPLMFKIFMLQKKKYIGVSQKLHDVVIKF